jgi:hypothetical protein
MLSDSPPTRQIGKGVGLEICWLRPLGGRIISYNVPSVFPGVGHAALRVPAPKTRPVTRSVMATVKL